MFLWCAGKQIKPSCIFIMIVPSGNAKFKFNSAVRLLYSIGTTLCQYSLVQKLGREPEKYHIKIKSKVLINLSLKTTRAWPGN